MLLQNSNINNSNDINNNTYGIYKNNILERINNSKNDTNNQKVFDINGKNRNYIDDYKKNLNYFFHRFRKFFLEFDYHLYYFHMKKNFP